MKVLIVNRYMSLYGGAETVVKELAASLTRRGIAAAVVTLNISPEVRSLCGELDIRLPREHFSYALRSAGFFSSLGIMREIKALRSLVKASAPDFDIINVHNFPASWIAGGLEKPVVWMCNEVPDFYNNPKPSAAVRLLRAAGINLDKRIVNDSIDTICAADEYNAALIEGRYGRRPEIVNYGIEYDFFSRAANVETKYAPGGFTLLQVGMLSPEKNQLKSVEAAAALVNDIPDITLVLAGRPQEPYASMLRERVAALGIADRVVFTGHITKSDVRDLYHACHIALFPVKSQGGWLSPFEALSAAKPIVTSTTMGAASVIGREQLGVVTDDLVSSIRDIYARYDEYREDARRACAWVKEHLTWERFTDKMVGVFEETIAKNFGL